METPKLSGMKGLVGQRVSQKFKFMGTDVEVSKLTVSQVLEIQNAAKEIQGDEAKGFDIIKKVIRMSVTGADEITDEEFDTFALDELSKLSNNIMSFSGIGEGNA